MEATRALTTVDCVNYVAHVVEMIRTEQSVDVYAAANSLDAVRLRETRDAFLAGATAARTPSPRRHAFIGALVAIAMMIPAGVLASTDCNTTLPGALKPFCPNRPANAVDVNENFREVAKFIEGRTGAMSGSVNDTTQVGGARLVAADNSFDLVATSLELNSGANGGTALQLNGDALSVGNPNFQGGLRLNQHTTAAYDLQVDGNLTSSNNLGINGTSALNGVVTFNNKPVMNAGLRRANCYEDVSFYNENNQYSSDWAECADGHYVIAAQCRGGGTNKVECRVKCCAP